MSLRSRLYLDQLLVAVALAVSAPAAGDGGPIFIDAASEFGLDFVHFNGMSGEYYFPEMTGQGGALLDYDRDGDLDLYLVQGHMLGPGKTLADALLPPPPGTPLTDRLLRNDSSPGPDGSLSPRFVDVTEESGLVADGYGMGVAVGDIDNDGWPDLYVTNFGANHLFRNRGDGTFADVSERSGTADPLWGTSATFADLDGDGWQDLVVANYVDFDLAANPRCFAASSRRDYCGPSDFPAQPDRIFLNRGDGTFEESARRVLGDHAAGPALGVAAADLNGDGRVDLFVANDGAPNRLWLNRGDGTFYDDAPFSGLAVNAAGRAEASMGVALGDADRDGDPDLFLTHLMGETNTLYLNQGGGLFVDRTTGSGLAAASLPHTAFGTSWIDIDNDGWPDLLVLNGAVRLQESADPADPYPLRQPNQLFANRSGAFEEVTAAAGDAFQVPEVSRGAAFGDVDNDGDPDVLQLNNAGPARLLLNQVGSRRGWLGVETVGRSGGGATIGTRLAVTPAGAVPVWSRVHTDGSYCSAGDPRVLAGLGSAGEAASLRALWPGGRVTEWRRPPRGRYLRIYE